MSKQYDKQFKADAVKYYLEHKERNYASDEAKEIARLKKELRDTQDALEILKKAIGILGNGKCIISLKPLNVSRGEKRNKNAG